MGAASPRLLLTVDDYYGALAAVRALAAAGYEPWVAAGERGTYCERSAAVAGTVVGPEPVDGTDAFVDFVAECARDLEVAAVLPATERSLEVLAGREEEFAPVPLGAGRPESLARLTDKRALAQLAAAAGLRAPETIPIDARALPPELPFPGLLKTAQTTQRQDGRAVEVRHPHRVESHGELAAVLAAAPDAEWIYQPFVEGVLLGVAGVVWEGRMLSSVQAEARRIFPLEAGGSAFAETVPPNRQLEALLAELLRQSGWSGLYQAQFLRAHGQHYLIDVNPRVYGTLALAIAAGHNLPAWWVELLLGREPSVPPYRVGVRFRSEERDVRALLGLLRRGRVGAFAAGVLPRRHVTHGVWSRRDPMPMLSLIAKFRRRVARPTQPLAGAAAPSASSSREATPAPTGATPRP